MSHIREGKPPLAIAMTIANAETSTLKRLAWAYGCARKGSDEERQLEALLLERAKATTTEETS